MTRIVVLKMFLCFFIFLTFVCLCLYYVIVKHCELYNDVIPTTNSDNPVISAMLDTIPSGGQAISNCAQLFGEKSLAHNFTLSEVFYNNIDNFLMKVNANKGTTTGHIYMVKFQFKLYHYLTSKLKFVRTVCETGFNVGHSTFNFLTARPDVVVHSFDIGHSSQLRNMASYLQQKFPGRLNITIGDSRHTVPRYFHAKRSTPPVTCDIISVDGSHTYDAPLKDILNFAQVASQPYNVILVDDVDAPAVTKAWKFAIESGIVHQISLVTCHYGRGGRKRFAVGMVVREKSIAMKGN